LTSILSSDKFRLFTVWFEKMIGKTVSHYKILDKIGQGGMGIVYKAADTKLKRTVALKFLPPELTRDSEAKERFTQEAQAAAALDHPNICTIHEIDEAEGQTFISMAYIEGQSLKERIESGPMEVKEVLDIAVQVAEGLKEAHEKGIVHRDIKPGNILVTKKGQVKITDFGLAKLEWGVDLTKTAAIMGTVAYMSPEQAKGEKVDQRTDIWSWCAMLYEMLTQKLPFKSPKDQATIYSILHEEPKPVSNLREDLPQNLERIIKKALEKEPSRRYQKVSEILGDMNALRAKLRDNSLETQKAESKPSIAVLPFVDMSPQKDQEYFCDGIAEELINALTHIKDLHVVARTSAFSFKGEKLDVREIGKKLNVNTVLEGSLRKASSRVRITAQLINVEDGYHLWSDKFDRELDDIFTIQDEISEAIVNNLKVTLLRREKEAVRKRYTDDLEAYSLYLKGIYFLRTYTAEGFKKAIEYFQHALEKDPDYAQAYAGLAEVFYAAAFWGNVSPRDAYPKAKDYATKALEMDEPLSDAHAALGLVYTFYDWNWREAEKELKRALKLNPNSSITHLSYSWYLTLTRHHEEAVTEARTAQALDPLSALINAHVGFALFWARKFDESIDELETALSITPHFFLSRYYLSMSLRAKSRMDEAIQENEKAVQFSNEAPFPTMILASTYFETGKIEQGERMFKTLQERSKREYLPPMGFYIIHLLRGERDQAYAWFKRALDERDSFLPWFLDFPVKKYGIPDEPRFNELLKKEGLEEQG
jgi:serine/threonine protein kinase/Tfp pilus assembly protein PilF